MLQGQYDDLPETHLYPLQPQYAQYDTQIGGLDYNPDFDYTGTNFETEPTEPGPLAILNLRRVYVVNKEVCVRTVCAHEELLRADLCRDKYAKCGVMANRGLCGQMASSCDKSCGSC
ncbi:hypothetical protein scyTo_0015891, partial [Scyliorhinus torazame]|nr:hypothetical protein [Scyliorhinus torazame]